MLCERDLANIVNILSYSSTVIDLQYFIFIRFNPWGYFLQDFSCHGSMLSVVFLSQKIIPEGQDFCIFELAAWYMILHCKQLIHVVESHAGVDAQTLVSQVLWSHRSSDPTDPALGTEDGWLWPPVAPATAAGLSPQPTPSQGSFGYNDWRNNLTDIKSWGYPLHLPA